MRSRKFFKPFIIIFLIVSWVFFGWPVIWQNPRIPSEIQKAQAAPIAQYSGGIIVYADGTAGTPKYKIFDDTNGFGSEQSAQSVGSNAITWLRVAANPINDEWTIVTKDSAGVIKAQVCTGVDGGISCGTPTTITSSGNTAAFRNFDIAYEYGSGDALIVYGTATSDELRKIEWTGGSWKNDAAITTTRTTSTVEWVELTSRGGTSNQIGIAYSDTNDAISAYRWNGTAAADEATGNIGSTALTANVRKFDISFEGSSGDMLVVSWVGGAGTARTGALSGTTWAIGNQTVVDVSSIQFLDLPEPPPNTDILAVEGHGALSTSNTTEGWEWTGSGVTDGNNGDDLAQGWTASYQLAAVSYLSSTYYGVAVFSSGVSGEQSDDIAWWTMNSSGTITDQANNSRSRGNARFIDLFDYPNADKVLLITADANSDLWADTWDGTTPSATVWVDRTSGGALETSLASITTDIVDFAFRLAPLPPTFNQSAYRFFENNNSTNVGASLATQDTAASLSLAGAAFRLRALIHIGDSQLTSSGQSFKLQFATRGGDNLCDTAFSGESYLDVTTSTAIAFNDNSTPADGAALTANASDPTHGSDTIVNQTYEELNNFTNSQGAIPVGQDGKWDFSLKDNNSTPTAATYCLRIVKSDGNLLNNYSVIPQITTSNITDYITGSLGKTIDSWYGAIPVSLQLHGSLTSQNYPYARAKVNTAASETYYTSLIWNSSTTQFEGVIYIGSWYCNGCADPTTGTFSVTVQLDNDSNFNSIDYQASAGSFSTYVARRWNAVNTTAMGYGTEFIPSWNPSGGYWNYTIEDFSIGGLASARTNVAFAIPFHPTTANISNISVTVNGTSFSEGSAASTTDCWWWDNNHHTLYVQKASVAASTYYTVNLNFRSDTDLFMTRVDRVQAYNMGERLFSNGILFGNNYINTVIFGCGHEGEGQQIELTGRNFSNNDDVNLDCMERVAVHVDNTIRTDSSNYYSADIKWKPNQCTSWIVSEDNNKIVWRVISDDTSSTGWAQQLNNHISATRTQEFYANKPYVKNIYEFKNNDSVSHTYPMVWGREQWLGTDRNVNDRGRYAGNTSNVIPETHILMSTSTLPETWFTTYDIGVYGAMGVIFNENSPNRYGYFLTSAPLLNESPWAEWVNYTSEYRVDDQQTDASGETDNIFLDMNWSNVSPSQAVSLTFWQWGYVTTSWTGIESAMRQSYYETGGIKTTQAAYRFYQNTNSTDVGDPLANLNTAATLTTTNQAFRLRLLMRVETNDLLANGKTFKLQFATKTGDTCGDDESFQDISAETPIAFNDNSTPIDGSNLTSNVNDPIDGARTVRPQTYEESNNFINSNQTIYVNEDGKWDFALKDNNAPAQTSYCFRVIKVNSGSQDYQVLNNYAVYPEIKTSVPSQSLTLTITPTTVNLGTLAPQIPITATTTATVGIVGYSNGYHLDIKRDSATSTLYLLGNPSITFPDYSPSWDPTANSGNGNATITPGSVFAFRLMSSGTTSNYNANWWGVNDNAGTAKYGGMPISSTNIVVCTSSVCQNGTTTSIIQYRADAPISQPVGNYTGTVTITVLGNI